jgi:hypothetical protein
MSTQALPLIKNYIDRGLLEETGAACDLWVTVSPERLSLFVASAASHQVIGLTVLDLEGSSFFQKGLFELRGWLEGLELYTREYKNVKIVFETPEFTIVPEPLFVAEKADVLLTAQFDLPKFYAVKSTRMDHMQCVNVFAVPDIFCSTLKVLFPQASVHHYAEYLLLSDVALNEQGQHTLCVNMHASYLDAVHLYHQELKFVNTFAFEADTDVIYFILSVAEQQKIAIDKLHLVLTGDINANGALLQLLRKYVPEVTLFKRDDIFSYPASFREFPDHQYFTHSVALLCE